MSNNSNTIKGSLNPNQYTTICNDVQSRCQSGEKVTVLALARQHGVNTAEMREVLTEHFGSRISFVRGRNGGIRIV